MNFNLIHFPNFKKTFFGTTFKTDILGLLERVRDEIGCRHIIHCYRQRPGDQPRNGVSDLTVVITVPSSWAARYSEKNYIAIDPIFQEGNPYFSPGVSGLVQDLAEEAIDKADVTKMLQDAQKHGLGTLFVAVSARHPSGMLGCSVFIFNTEGQDNKAFITKMRAKLLSVSGSIHNTLCAGNEPTSPSSLLTPREIDCLRWAASGKTDGEIGEILSIARWTVVTYLQNAKIKLGCSNRTSAVATALALGIIDMPAVQHLT